MPRKSKVNKESAVSSVPEVLIKAVENLAERIVMAEPDDLPEMAGICKGLGDIAGKLSGLAGMELCSEAAARASALVEGVILGESRDIQTDIRLVGETVAGLQQYICEGRTRAGFRILQGRPAGGPGESSVDRAADEDSNQAAATALSSGSAAGVPAGIDPDLFEPFLDQQESVLPDIEAEILGFEADAGAGHLSALKRMIHTMKGEAGVCGVADIEKLCHKLEDYLATALEEEQAALSLDLLFKVKDCLESIIAGYRAGRTTDCAARLLKELDCAAGGKGHEEQPGCGVSAMTASMSVEADAGSQGCRAESVDITDPDLAADFVAEAQEHFETADENLLKLEDNPGNRDAVNAVFRAFHTIKGVSGFIGLKPIGDLAHLAETLLDDVRKSKRSFDGSVVDVTFEGLDMLKAMLGDLGVALTEGRPFRTKPELGSIMERLKDVLEGREIESAKSDAGKKKEDQRTNSKFAAEADAGYSTLDTGEDGAENRKIENEKLKRDEGEGGSGKVGIKQTMKVDADKIELLLDTIGELVIAQSVVAGDPDILNLRSQRVEKNLSHLSKITRSLQDLGMAMRMVPIEPTFRKMARLVRDLSKKTGKEIDFVMEGAETELDKGMVEKLGDPLVHMVRNSVDHGIEASAEDRIKAGKKAAGRVVLRAFHRAGSINIEIEDDGRGLDRDAIIAKGIEKGLISDGSAMSDQDVFSLIFQPGFSTAKQITEVSGRGVGMDVVSKNIESLRGNVLIKSEKGKGAVFTIVLPLTMAIIDGMSVRVSDEVYIVPTLSIIESLRPSSDMISTVTGRGEVMKFRDRLLPLFRLSRLFGSQGALEEASEALAVVVEDSGRQVALVVDELIGQQQTVIKSLGAAMGKVPGISGASIMADGQPGLIVDVGGVVKIAMEQAGEVLDV